MLLFCFLLPLRGNTALCVSSPASGDFLSHCMEVEAIPVKDTERLFVLLSVVNSYEPFDNLSKPISHISRLGKLDYTV